MGGFRLRRTGGVALRQRGVHRLTHLLDTNAISRYLRGRTPNLVGRVNSTLPSGLATYTIVEAELRYGLVKGGESLRQAKTLEWFLSLTTILPFDSDAAKEYGRLRTRLERAGTPIGPNDLMIASICLVHGLTLVTHNVAEFARVPELKVEDWEV